MSSEIAVDYDRRVVLSEHDKRSNVPLASEQAASLRQFKPKLHVSPSLGGGWDIETTSWIGGIETEGLALEIRPKLPVQRVLFLLSYSLDPTAWRRDEFEFRKSESFLQALAPAFVILAQRALSRGLLHDYRRKAEALPTIRGRLRFDEQIRRWHGRTPPVEVAYDDFTADVDENRLLLSAVLLLGRMRFTSREVQRELRGLRSRLQGVNPPPNPSSSISKVDYNRRNRHYRPALRLARLLLSGSSLRTRHGETTASSLLVDMNRVFEDFVVAALREALQLSKNQFPQQAAGRGLWLDQDRNVRLKPDISRWRGNDCTLVGDVKYKSPTDQGIQNQDLYQVLSYLLATDLTEGFLLYAARRDTDRTIAVRNAERNIRIVGIDLTYSPEALLTRISGIAESLQRFDGNRQIA